MDIHPHLDKDSWFIIRNSELKNPLLRCMNRIPLPANAVFRNKARVTVKTESKKDRRSGPLKTGYQAQGFSVG